MLIFSVKKNLKVLKILKKLTIIKNEYKDINEPIKYIITYTVMFLERLLDFKCGEKL